MQTLRPWQVSFLFHAVFVALVVALTYFRLSPSEVYEVPIEIYEPQDIQNLAEIKETPKVVLKSVNEPVSDSKPVREIFGASRESYTDKNLGKEGVEAKK